MRAIQPTHRRRGLAAGLVMTSVIALSILGGGTALAANPNWQVGRPVLVRTVQYERPVPRLRQGTGRVKSQMRQWCVDTPDTEFVQETRFTSPKS